jgi:hypothetical protein
MDEQQLDDGLRRLQELIGDKGPKTDAQAIEAVGIGLALVGSFLADVRRIADALEKQTAVIVDQAS